jgi:fructokinase
MIIAAIEAGGTKFVCGLFASTGVEGKRPELLDSAVLPTTSPEQTLQAAADFIRSASERPEIGPPEALGIACFGPVELKRLDPAYGFITATPKPGWKNVDVVGFFLRELGLRAAFDTDVNAAACAEQLWGAARGVQDFIYITVGTGIGGGVVSNGLLVHGMAHPELGHIKVRRHGGDSYEGYCPFHRDCLEGLASGPAIAERWRAKPEDLDPSHPAWELEARYLAQAAACYTLVLSPELILLGGGVGLRPGLAERISPLIAEELAEYIPALGDPKRLATFVKRPELGHDAGLYGAAAIALRGGSSVYA